MKCRRQRTHGTERTVWCAAWLPRGLRCPARRRSGISYIAARHTNMALPRMGLAASQLQ